jgi:hypothetical protein
MKKDNYFSAPRNLIIFGISMMLFSNPVLYLSLGTASIELQQLFGSSIPNGPMSLDYTNPLIQGMQVISGVGFLVILYGLWLRKHKQRAH